MNDAAVGNASDLYDYAPCGLLVTSSDDVITTVNDTFLKWTGYRREELIGRDFHRLLDDGGRAFYATRYQAELWSRREIREVAFRLNRADGSVLPILVNAALSSPTSETSQVRLAVFDSTTREDYEREMLIAKRQAETSEASVRVLQEASTLFLASENQADLANALARVAQDAFSAREVAVVIDGPKGELTVPAGAHLRPALQALRDAGLNNQELMVPNQTLIVQSLDDAYARSPEIGDIFRSIRAEAMSALAIVDGSTRLGALVCLYGRPRQIDERALQLHHALARQAAAVLSRIRLQDELREMAMHDQLTGLANRNLLRERLSHALAVSERSGEPLSLIFVDLDGFKIVNDELGHHVGDMVLATVAQRMKSVVREADIVGRFGGDEFLVICENADADAASAVADRLTEELRRPMADIPEGFGVTASLGVIIYDPAESPAQTSDSLVRMADAAMYESKRAGADRATLIRA